MKTISSILFLTIMSVIVLTSACDKEDETPVDVREQAVGSYNGTMEILALDDYNVEYSEENISFTVAKNSGNSTSIDISVEGDVVKGVKVAEASNGFTFDVENQNIDLDDDGDNETIEGVDFFELGGTKYHGMYDSGKNELSFAMSSSIEVDTDDDGLVDTEMEVLIGISGVK